MVDTFLLTYRKFISAENLVERLFERYNLKPPRPLSEMDPHSISMHEHALKVVRLRSDSPPLSPSPSISFRSPFTVSAISSACGSPATSKTSEATRR